jgi:hypothetical protein
MDDLEDTECDGVDWTHMVENRVHCNAHSCSTERWVFLE